MSYFDKGKAEAGNDEWIAEYHGAQWLFTSQEHLYQFKAMPEKYAPQYGGYCAYAAGAKNTLVSSDPEAWKIVNGKLYLNYNKDIQKKWEVDQASLVELAYKNWITLSKQ